jgi:hypothetical protein
MIKRFKKYEVEFSGTIVYIRDNSGELLKASDVNPNDAISGFNSICSKLSKINS